MLRVLIYPLQNVIPAILIWIAWWRFKPTLLSRARLITFRFAVVALCLALVGLVALHTYFVRAHLEYLQEWLVINKVGQYIMPLAVVGALAAFAGRSLSLILLVLTGAWLSFLWLVGMVIH